MILCRLDERAPINSHYHGWTRQIYYTEEFNEDEGTETITFHVNSEVLVWQGSSWDADKVLAKVHKDVSRKFRQLIAKFVDVISKGSNNDELVEDIPDYFIKTFANVNGSEVNWNYDLGKEVLRILRICGFKKTDKLEYRK